MPLIAISFLKADHYSDFFGETKKVFTFHSPVQERLPTKQSEKQQQKPLN